MELRGFRLEFPDKCPTPSRVFEEIVQLDDHRLAADDACPQRLILVQRAGRYLYGAISRVFDNQQAPTVEVAGTKRVIRYAPVAVTRTDGAQCETFQSLALFLIDVERLCGIATIESRQVYPGALRELLEYAAKRLHQFTESPTRDLFEDRNSRVLRSIEKKRSWQLPEIDIIASAEDFEHIVQRAVNIYSVSYPVTVLTENHPTEWDQLAPFIKRTRKEIFTMTAEGRKQANILSKMAAIANREAKRQARVSVRLETEDGKTRSVSVGTRLPFELPPLVNAQELALDFENVEADQMFSQMRKALEEHAEHFR